MKFRKLIVSAATVALAGVPVLSAHAATSAAAPKATGSVGIASAAYPLQYLSFSAITGTPAKGNVSYANFSYADAGSGVWNVSGLSQITVLGTYVHSATAPLAITPTSTTASTVTGTMTYDGTTPEQFAGSVAGNAISFTLTYTNGYVYTATGTINPDGSMSGTGTDSTGQTGLTWTAPAGSAFEVLSYTTPVACAAVAGTIGTFAFTIPSGSLAGTKVVNTVADNGTPGTSGDTVAQRVGDLNCGSGATDLNGAVTSGNLVVH
jgi:hypothetical protein